LKVTDFFFHPIVRPLEEGLFSVDTAVLQDYLATIKNKFNSLSINTGLLTIFSPNLVSWSECAFHDSIKLSVLLDFRSAGAFQVLEQYKASGIRALVFHPYLQKISQCDWPQIIKLAKYAEKMGFFFIICTAYGSKDIYACKVLPFVRSFAGSVNAPIVLAHCGGARILEAFLIADCYSNIFLETSFSLPYWKGSSVSDDIAFCMKKLGCNRWLYGSDAPFVDMQVAIREHMIFFEKYRFSDIEIEQIMGKNSTNYFEI
jgi:predicted TIM-barrel fold metal-dependent hydrolase